VFTSAQTVQCSRSCSGQDTADQLHSYVQQMFLIPCFSCFIKPKTLQHFIPRYRLKHFWYSPSNPFAKSPSCIRDTASAPSSTPVVWYGRLYNPNLLHTARKGFDGGLSDSICEYSSLNFCCDSSTEYLLVQ
jgi:hypothetical protein